jgi:acyl dehydratase
VIEFAGKYDPQPFHLSDEAAAATHFGRLSASGWHTCAMTMAMIVEEQDRAGHQGLGSPASTNCAGAIRSIPATPCAWKPRS